MLSYNNGYTEAEAFKALTGSNPKWRFPVALLDNKNGFLRWLSLVRKETGDIDRDTTRDFIAQFQVQVTEGYDFKIDPYYHRLQPWVFLRMSTNGTDGTPYLKYPQGVFVASSFLRKRNESKRWVCEIGGDDLTKILTFGCPAPFTVAAATPYTNAIKDILVAARFDTTTLSVEPHAGLVAVTKEYEAGTPWILMLRDYVKPINYEWFFDNGLFVARKWVDWRLRVPEWQFIPDGHSVVYTEQTEDEGEGLDTPNLVFGTVSRQTPDGPIIFSAQSENTNENSKFSTARRGFVIPYKMTLVDAPDQPTFQEQVDRKLAEFSYAAKTTTLETGLIPFLSPLALISARTEDDAILLDDFELTAPLVNGWYVDSAGTQIKQGWYLQNMTGAVSDGVFKGKANNNDPYMFRRTGAFNEGQKFHGGTYRYFKFVLKLAGDLRLGFSSDFIQVFFATEREYAYTSEMLHTMQVTADGEYHEYLLDMWNVNGGGGAKWKTDYILELRIDPSFTQGRRFELAEAKLIKNENKYIVEKTKYELRKGAKMFHTVRLVTTTT
jgi:hypothetical protein